MSNLNDDIIVCGDKVAIFNLNVSMVLNFSDKSNSNYWRKNVHVFISSEENPYYVLNIIRKLGRFMSEHKESFTQQITIHTHPRVESKMHRIYLNSLKNFYVKLKFDQSMIFKMTANYYDQNGRLLSSDKYEVKSDWSFTECKINSINKKKNNLDIKNMSIWRN